MTYDAPTSGIVVDGLGRWWDGVAAEVRTAVAAEFAERLREATALVRVRLRLEIEREVS